MRIFIAASGSGGHLFPALHIASALKRLDASVEIEFIGAGRPLEFQLISPHYPLHIVTAARVMQQGLWGIPKLLEAIPKAVVQLWRLFRHRPAHVVVGVGGYASVLPVFFAAEYLRVPTLIHEAESRPGLANRVLAPFVSVVSTARDECKIWGSRKVLRAGQPMRAGLTLIRPAAELALKSLLIMGGSQGAASLDRAASAIAKVAAQFNLTVVHQTRADGVTTVQATYQAAGVSAQVVSFISDMAAIYSQSDLIISRAGASTVGELEVIGRPVIFVPYPHAQGNHQIDNARSLAECGRAIICEEGAGFEDRLVQLLNWLIQGEHSHSAPPHQLPSYQSMRRLPQSTRNERAADLIAQQILALAAESQ